MRSIPSWCWLHTPALPLCEGWMDYSSLSARGNRPAPHPLVKQREKDGVVDITCPGSAGSISSEGLSTRRRVTRQSVKGNNYLLEFLQGLVQFIIIIHCLGVINTGIILTSIWYARSLFGGTSQGTSGVWKTAPLLIEILTFKIKVPWNGKAEKYNNVELTLLQGWCDETASWYVLTNLCFKFRVCRRWLNSWRMEDW